MAGETHLVRFCDRHDALQEVGDALPVEIGRDMPGDRRHIGVEFGIGGGFGVLKGAVVCASAPRSGGRTRYAEEGEIVFEQKDPGVGGIGDHRADLIDLAVPLRILAKQNIRHLRRIDGGRTHRQRYGGQRDSMLLHPFAQTSTAPQPTIGHRECGKAGRCRYD